MEEYQDLKEFIKLLIEKKVEYLIVGGFAVTFHSRAKFTEDMDVWIKKTKSNAKKIFNVLNEFGFGNIELNEDDFLKPGFVIQLGYPPNRIDIMTDLEGLTFANAYKKSKPGIIFKNLEVRYLSYNDLLLNKQKVSRPKDIFDIEWIKKYNNKKSR
jgi:predicted nucleotidyltransferase